MTVEGWQTLVKALTGWMCLLFSDKERCEAKSRHDDADRNLSFSPDRSFVRAERSRSVTGNDSCKPAGEFAANKEAEEGFAGNAAAQHKVQEGQTVVAAQVLQQCAEGAVFKETRREF